MDIVNWIEGPCLLNFVLCARHRGLSEDLHQTQFYPYPGPQVYDNHSLCAGLGGKLQPRGHAIDARFNIFYASQMSGSPKIFQL